MSITGVPLQASIHERMHFVVAQPTEVATRLSALWAVVSVATQSIHGHLPIDVSQEGVVGEMVTWF
jgi:hypothetical protein